MSDDAQRPDAPDPDAWAAACEEDLAEEKARRRARYGPPPTSAAEELRRLADAVTEKVAEIGKPLVGAAGSAAAQGVARQLFAQARATLEPVVERNPEFFDHLAAAGGELLAAYRSVVQESERRWSAPRDANAGGPAAGAERIDVEPVVDAEEAADLSVAADRDSRVVDERIQVDEEPGAEGSAEEGGRKGPEDGR
ncbi:DUF5304 family protein [Streptomyces albus]|uniref:DUF5304 family protein n=1 Tax=Streptomyces albus TaxID=1888 RepID=UPI00156E3EC8